MKVQLKSRVTLFDGANRGLEYMPGAVVDLPLIEANKLLASGLADAAPEDAPVSRGRFKGQLVEPATSGVTEAPVDPEYMQRHDRT